MKQSVIAFFMATAFICVTPAGSLGEEGGEDSGFSGMIHLGVMYESRESNLEADDDNKKITSLGKPNVRGDELMPIPLFDLRYAFPSGTSIYAGVPMEETRPRVGVSQKLPGESALSASFHYNFPDEVWKDPYITGVNRKETDVDSLGGRIDFECHNMEVGYEYNSVDVDEDIIGKRLKKLARDGAIHQGELSYNIDLGGGNMIAPGFQYTYADMDGESNSHNGYMGELTYMKMAENYMLHLSLGSGLLDYDEIHPIFNKTREDKVYEAMGMISWLNPLGFKRFSINLGAGFERTDSNIDFYDSDGHFTFFTVGYSWGGDDGHDD